MDVFNIRRSRGKHALVLSVSGHENNTVSNLYNPDIDAAKLKATLLKLGGWTVQMVADRGLEQTKKKIKEFAALRARGDDDCLFAFVGHGIELNDRNYLVAADSKLDPTYSTEATFEQAVKRECLPFEDVQVAFKNARESSAGATVFLLDCCRIGVSTSVGSGRVAGGFTSRAADSSVIRPQFPHTMVVYSTTSGNVASDGLPSDGGAFMGIFCEEVASGAAVAAVMQNTLRRLLEWGSHIC
ncbi:hypothetical protein T484DRAFT_1815734 [Baffinella frigidus]|nr:hypothetical protein T484DRAFT_1815734 [Cryptophyta sp. CCMP2293]